MARSRTTSVAAYLEELPAERRGPIARMLAFVRQNLPAGFRETIQFGMIAWEVPLERYPQAYNGKGLMRAALAAQKQYNALYLSCTYLDREGEALLREGARREGKRLDMGRSCVRFRAPEDLPLDAVATLLRRLSVDGFVAAHERARGAASRAGAKQAHKPLARSREAAR